MGLVRGKLGAILTSTISKMNSRIWASNALESVAGDKLWINIASLAQDLLIDHEEIAFLFVEHKVWVSYIKEHNAWTWK